MSIIGALPVTLTNGTTADATQVMSNFNSIVSQVNANGAALAGGNAFTGTQTIAGDNIVTASATQTVSGKTFTGPNGAVGAPTYSFSASTSTGVWSPTTNTVGIATNGVNAVYIDARQNIGLSTTPSVWATNYNAIQFETYGVAYDSAIGLSGVANNVYFNGTNWIYRTTNAASRFEQSAANGTQSFYVAGSGTAGNPATFTLGFVIDFTGRIYGSALHNNSTPLTGATNQYIGSGTYTPTLTGVSNITADSVPGTWQWIRVGNVVNVSGYMSVTPTAASAWSIRATLPIPSATTNLAGCVQGFQVSGSAASVLSGSSQALISATATTTGAGTVVVSFTYEVA